MKGFKMHCTIVMMHHMLEKVLTMGKWMPQPENGTSLPVFLLLSKYCFRPNVTFLECYRPDLNPVECQ